MDLSQIYVIFVTYILLVIIIITFRKVIINRKVYKFLLIMFFVKRKINLVGNSTLTVSLPSKWVKKNNLEKGDELEVEENGQQLIINSGAARKKLSEITINFDEDTTSSIVWRYMKSAYTHGYDTIIVNFSKKIIPYTSKDLIVFGKKEISVEEFIHIIANRMFGLALIERHGNKFILKDIGINTNVDINELTKKISMQVKILAEKVLYAIDSGDKIEYENVVVVENNINNLEDYGIRILNKINKYEAVYSDKYLFLTFLEHIGDGLFDIFRKVVVYGMPFTKETRKYYLELIAKYEKFHNTLWYNKKDTLKVCLEISDFEKKLMASARDNVFLLDFANLCNEMGVCLKPILHSLCESRVIDE